MGPALVAGGNAESAVASSDEPLDVDALLRNTSGTEELTLQGVNFLSKGFFPFLMPFGHFIAP